VIGKGKDRAVVVDGEPCAAQELVSRIKLREENRSW
jgi:hypothetical protein